MLELNDDFFMKQAIRQAEMAYEEDEVPIGAVVVLNNKIIGKGYNQTEKLNDVTAHAEMLALTAAFASIGGKWLDECSLYVTIEPCAMCAGAIQWARPKRLIFGASEPKFGFGLFAPSIVSSNVEIVSGVLETECASLMKSFFQSKRRKKAGG